MRRGDVVRALLVGALTALGGYLVGRNEADDTVRRERDEARGEAQRWQETAQARDAAPPTPGVTVPLAVAPAREGAPAKAPPAAPAAGAADAGAGERPASLDLKDVATTEELTARFLAFAASRLGEGTKGHLELLRAIDTIGRDVRFRRTLTDDREAVRFAYPAIRFAVTHEGQVTDFVETVFRMMAEQPSALEGVAKATLEMFTEGLGLFLPSTISEERLDVLRGYVRRVLAAPRDSLPEGLRGNLGRLKRILEWWAPPMSTEDLLAALADLPAEEGARREVLRQARRLSAEEWAKVDVPSVLGPLIASGDWAALALVQSAAPAGGTLQALDARVLQAAPSITGNAASAYLQATGRSAWPAARGFFEAWATAGGGQNFGFSQAILRLSAPPSADEVHDLAARADMSEENRQALLRAAAR